MSQPVAMVTGAGGEMARLLIPALRKRGRDVVAVDLVALPQSVQERCVETVEASITDRERMQELLKRHRPRYVFHLAAVLSAKAERDPDLAHRVNVEGTLDLLRNSRDIAGTDDAPVRFVFPSSIAIYGLPDAATKAAQGAVTETEWTVPTAMYGCNKLYCELVGRFLASRSPRLEFRSIRFPGLISAETLPTSGTTDYAPAMIHAAVSGRSYTCFVDPDARLPFMTMPDAVEAMLQLAEAEPAGLSAAVYNIKGFSASASEIREEVRRHYPAAEIDFDVSEEKQALVDSWPADVDDTRARTDWGLAPKHDLARALADYLIPALRRRYGTGTGAELSA